MSNEQYTQEMLPGFNENILYCACRDPYQDKLYGKFKRLHILRSGVYNGKYYAKRWFCTKCGRPYQSNKTVRKQLDRN